MDGDIDGDEEAASEQEEIDFPQVGLHETNGFAASEATVLFHPYFIHSNIHRKGGHVLGTESSASRARPGSALPNHWVATTRRPRMKPGDLAVSP